MRIATARLKCSKVENVTSQAPGKGGWLTPIYHSGELAVQERAGVRVVAERVGQSITTVIPSRARDFVIAQPIAILGTVDGGGRVWAFFIASYHPQASADASHRGGKSGFVRVRNSRRLEWTDYQGNNMFQTLGNIHSYPKCGSLFIDFETGATLQLTGTAKTVWNETSAGEPGGRARSVEFEIDEVVRIALAIGLRWRFLSYSPFNP